MGAAQLTTGLGGADFTTLPGRFDFRVLRSPVAGSRAEALTAGLRRRDPFSLPLTDERALGFRDVGQQLQYDIGNQRSRQITVGAGIEEGHVEDDDGGLLLLRDDTPLVKNLLVVAPQAVDGLDDQDIPWLERVNAPTLHLIRSFLKAGVMEGGLVSPTTEGVPQGGPLSPVLSNVYLDKFDKELESRGLRFVRYADDCNIFVRSEMAADRVIASVSSWLERKLRLKVNASKSKVVRPTGSTFLGFTFWKSTDGWRPRPAKDRKDRICGKVKTILCRRKAAAVPLGYTFTKLNQVLRGWINYFRIGSMKVWLRNDFGPWMRHKVRVVILKQWKKPKTIQRNLSRLNTKLHCNMSDEDIYKTANSRLGWYGKANGNVVNFLLSPKVLAMPNKKENRPGLVDPLAYYLGNT